MEWNRTETAFPRCCFPELFEQQVERTPTAMAVSLGDIRWTYGELNRRAYGPSARPKLPEGISRYAWKPDAHEADQHRRSIYVLAKRNLRYPLFDVYDLPDMHNSCARRTQTTTAPQALLLLNGEFVQEHARDWSEKLQRSSLAETKSKVALAYRCAWGRPATEEEIRLGMTYLRQPGATLGDFCHALLNTNEFLYVD